MRFRASIRLHAFSIRRRRTAARAAVLAAALAAAPRPAPAQVSPNGPEFQVNTYTTNAQRVPSVAVGGAGDLVVVWQSYGSFGSDPNGHSIQARRYAANGGPLGGEFQVNTYTTHAQYSPSVAVDVSGNFVVAWMSYGSGGNDQSGYSIQAQRYAESGAPLGGQFQVNTLTTSFQGRPSVVMDSTGRFLVAWESFVSGGSDSSGLSIQAQIHAANGTPLGAQFQVNTYMTDHQRYPSVAVDGAGNFVVAWESEGSFGSDQSSTSIQAQRYDVSGAPLGGEFQVNSYTTNYQRNPSVAADNAGSFVVAWASYGSSGSDQSAHCVQAQRYDANGAPLGGQFQVNTYTTVEQGYPSVAMNGAGNFVVAWQSYGSGGSDQSEWSIQAQRYSANGAPVGGEFQVNTYTTNYQRFPSLAVDAAGNFVVAWEHEAPYGGYDVRAQRFDQLFRDGFATGDTARWSETTP